MKTPKQLIIALSLCFSLTVLSAAPLMAKDIQLLMRGNSTSSSYYAYCVAAAEVINKVPGINVTLTSIAGGNDATQRMSRGDIDIANGRTMGGGYQRYHGIGAFEGKPEPRLRVMYLFLANPVAFTVREDSGIKTIQDLNGKPFNPGGKGTATATLAKKVLDLAGIQPKYFEASYSDAVSAIKDKRIVGMAKLTAGRTPDAVLMELMVATEIRILSWDNALLDKILKEVPYYGKTTIPAGVYKGSWNKREIPTWSQTMGCMVLKDLSEDAVYKMVKALCEDKTVQVSGFPPIKGTDFVELTLDQASIPLHRGTVKYFKELGVKIPSALIPPEAK